MVRPSVERSTFALTDVQSLEVGDGTDVGGDDVDFDGGGTGGGGGTVVTPPATEPVETVADAGDAVDINLNTARWWDITLTEDCALEVSGAPASGMLGELNIILRQGTGAPWLVTWDSVVTWPDTDGTEGGSAPTLHTVEDAVDVITLRTVDGGTTWGGSYDSAGTGGSAVEVDEDGVSVVAVASVLDFQHGFDVTDGGGGTAEVDIDEGELTHNSLGGLTSGDPHTQYVTVIEGGGDTISTHGSMGATETIDPTDGNVHTATVNADVVITFAAPSGGGYCGLVVRLTQDMTGGHAVTFSGSVTVIGTIPTTASDACELFVESLDAGSTWTVWVIGSGSVVVSLDDLSDVEITAPAEGDELRYRSGLWVNETGSGGSHFEVLMTGASPPEPVETDDETDWIYGEV